MPIGYIPEIDVDYRATREPYVGAARNGRTGTKGWKERDAAIAAEVARCRARIEADRRRREKAQRGRKA